LFLKFLFLTKQFFKLTANTSTSGYSGVDGIPAKFLKQDNHVVSLVLSTLFNRNMELGVYSDCLKESRNSSCTKSSLFYNWQLLKTQIHSVGNV